MAWLPDVKIKNKLIRFDTIHERDGQTHTQTPHDGKGGGHA